MKSSDVVGKRSAHDPQFSVPERRPVTETGIIGDEVTIRTVQGFGDIIWVYQKFAPYFRKLNFTIYITADDPVQKRCTDMLRIFEQTGTVNFEIVPSKVYQKAANHFYRLQDALDDYKAGRPVEYACNGWLDNGFKLDEIDPGAVVAHDIKIKQIKISAPQNYLALYVSHGSMVKSNMNNPRLGLWDCETWARFATKFMDQMGEKMPIVLLGAKFDEDALAKMDSLLRPDNEVYVLMQEAPEVVAGVLANARFFIGYQSGLHVLADLLNTPQIIILFNCLRPMLDTWCRQDHIGNKFISACFEDDRNAILDRAVTAWKGNF